MVQTCCVKNCTKRRKPGTNISFHQFPKNPELKQKWIKAIYSNNSELSNHLRVCSKHFANDSFIQNPWSSQRMLKPDAIPNISNVMFDVPETEYIEEVYILSEGIKTENKITNLQNKFEDHTLIHNDSAIEKDRSMERSLRKKRKCYIGDFKEGDISDKENFIEIVNLTIKRKNNEIKILKQKNRRLMQKIKDLHSLVDNLKNKNK